MKKRLLILIVLVGILAGGAFALGLFDKKESEKTRSQLTGVEVEKDRAERPILGIMIENSKEARPQTGLDSAGIVFEAVTEGGITRYLALYQENMPEEVGPVRSLRMHFLDWVMGFDASIGHVGGSAESLKEADEREAKSLNQFKYNEPYFRDNNKVAPHNMYAKLGELRNEQKESEHKKSNFSEIPRSNDVPSQNPQAKNVTIDYSGPLFKAEFRYDQASNSYTRYLAGDPHIDEVTDKPITVKNVVVLKMPKNANAQEGALENGEALIFKDGNVTKARWRQSSFKERIKIVDDQNNEISLNRGDSWFAALPEGRPLTY